MIMGSIAASSLPYGNRCGGFLGRGHWVLSTYEPRECGFPVRGLAMSARCCSRGLPPTASRASRIKLPWADKAR
jgi:hypothetical protein